MLVGCSSVVTRKSEPLLTMPRAEAEKIIQTPAASTLDGAFSPRVSIEEGPASDWSLRRDTLEDFFYAAHVTVSQGDFDRVIIRRLADAKLAFIFMRGSTVADTFLVSAQNALRCDDRSASFLIERGDLGPGSVTRSATALKMEVGENGNLEFTVDFWSKINTAGLGIPYGHAEARWRFSLTRIQ
jgi:hypothetical protein